jgi:drug/metabolite transporter (DMT)-like permease
MVDAAPTRFLAIIAGTVLWNVGSVLQKKAVEALPRSPLRVFSLVSSGRWMAGLLVTAIGWGLYVFGLERIQLSTARTLTGGSYIVLAFFSIVFLRTPLRAAEWLAVLMVSAGIFLLGTTEPSPRPHEASAIASSLPAVALGAGCVALLCLVLSRLGTLKNGSLRSFLSPLAVFAAISGLLSSVGDLLMKALLSVGFGLPSIAAALAVGIVAFYVTGFYMLSRAYQAGTMVGAVVISDFLARLGAIVLGAAVLGEPLAGAGVSGALRAAGLLLVLGGSLLLGRFSGTTARNPA